MKLFVKYKGTIPAFIIGFAPQKHSPLAILIIPNEDHPIAANLEDCIFLKVPKRLMRKAKRIAKRETHDIRAEVIASGGGEAD